MAENDLRARFFNRLGFVALCGVFVFIGLMLAMADKHQTLMYICLVCALLSFVSVILISKFAPKLPASEAPRQPIPQPIPVRSQEREWRGTSEGFGVGALIVAASGPFVWQAVFPHIQSISKVFFVILLLLGGVAGAAIESWLRNNGFLK